MKYIKTALPIILIAVLGLAAYFRLQSNRETKEKMAQEREVEIDQVPVRVGLVKKDTLFHNIELAGTFRASRELPVVIGSPGRIAQLLIQEGHSVNKGQKLAVMDDAVLRSRLKLANITLANAEKNVERYRNLLDAGAISLQQFEKVELEMENARVQVAGIEKEIEATVVRSPLSGIVKNVNLLEGSFANPGVPLATIVDLARLKLILQAQEQEVVKIKKGATAKISTDAYPNHIFEGQVSNISLQADLARKFDVEIELSNSITHPLKAGMLGSVTIPAGKEPQEVVLAIPRAALTGSLIDPKAYVVEDGKARIRMLQADAAQDGNVIIRRGLSEGEKVIISGQINLEDGKKVRIVD